MGTVLSGAMGTILSLVTTFENTLFVRQPVAQKICESKSVRLDFVVDGQKIFPVWIQTA